MSESIEVKMARVEERMKSLEGKVDDISKMIGDIHQSITTFHEKSEAQYATKRELEEVKKNIWRNLVASNLLTGGVVAIFMYLLNFYLDNVRE